MIIIGLILLSFHFQSQWLNLEWYLLQVQYIMQCFYKQILLWTICHRHHAEKWKPHPLRQPVEKMPAISSSFIIIIYSYLTACAIIMLILLNLFCPHAEHQCYKSFAILFGWLVVMTFLSLGLSIAFVSHRSAKQIICNGFWCWESKLLYHASVCVWLWEFSVSSLALMWVHLSSHTRK